MKHAIPARAAAMLLACSLGLTVTVAAQETMSGGMREGQGRAMMAPKMLPAAQEKMMKAWPKASKEAARAMSAKYGKPMYMNEHMAMWGKAGPWKRTVVYSHEVQHAFPGPHTDVMQQWIDYRVPPAMYDELAAFDGSVVVERTNGEMSARCDKEAANLLAINLAHEIVTGKRTAEDARRMYGEQIMAMKAGRPAPYTERLMVAMMSATADPDQPLK